MAWTDCFEVVKNSAGENIGGDVATIKCLEPLFKQVISSTIGLAGIALFIMLLIAGFTYLFAGGDQKKLEQAKGTLTNAVIGLVVIVVAYLILRTIGVFTGLEDTITKFEIPTQ